MLYFYIMAIPKTRKKEVDRMENNTTPAPVKEKVKLTERIKNALSGIPAERKNKVIRLVILVAAILLITNPGLIPFLPSEMKYMLVGAMSSLLGNVTDISSVIPLNWIVIIKLVVMVLLLQIIKEVCMALLGAVKPKTGKGKTVLNLALSGFNYLMVFLGIFWGLAIMGVNLSTLFASVGILALIVGFGAEKLIADVVTGLFMIFENEYNVGDIIELGGYRGTVTSIGIRTTCVTDGGGNVKVFNNSDMRNIVNLSSQGSTAVCDFDIPYEMKIADAEKALEKVLKEIQAANPEVFPELPVYEGVQLLGANAVTLRVSASVKEADRFKAARLLNRGLKEGMERMGITSPYNQIVVHRAD